MAQCFRLLRSACTRCGVQGFPVMLDWFALHVKLVSFCSFSWAGISYHARLVCFACQACFVLRFFLGRDFLSCSIGDESLMIFEQLSFCFRSVVALLPFCFRFAAVLCSLLLVLLLLRFALLCFALLCFAFALFLLCFRFACFAFALLPLCFYFSFAWISLRFAFALLSFCFRFAFALLAANHQLAC